MTTPASAPAPPPARQRAVIASAALVVASVVGFVLAVVNDWPQPAATSGAVGLSAAVGGTATSLPLVPVAVLLAAGLTLRYSPSRGHAAALVALGLLSIAALMAGIASFSAISPYVPGEVLDRTGAVYVVLGLGGAMTAALAMRERLALAAEGLRESVGHTTPRPGAGRVHRGRNRPTSSPDRGALMTEQPATAAGTTEPAGAGVSDEELAKQVGGQTSSDLQAEDVFERENDGAAGDTEAAKADADDLR